MSESCLKKQAEVEALFATCCTQEAKYKKIIELGQRLPPFDPAAKTTDRLVRGCQSVMYLQAWAQDTLIYFNADSDALISRGLAALLIRVYSGETAESVVLSPPHFLTTLGIYQALSPGRSNGLASLYDKMRQLAVTHLTPP